MTTTDQRLRANCGAVFSRFTAEGELQTAPCVRHDQNDNHCVEFIGKGGPVTFRWTQDDEFIQPPPTAYRHWRSGLADTGREDGDWPWLVDSHREESTEDWMALGWAPRPKTTLSRFKHDFGHGLVMGYPFWSVLAFAWRNRRPGWMPKP